MVRRPIIIQPPSGSRLIAHKVVGQEIAVTDNFQVTQHENTIEIRWRVFNPDMSLKLALARAGSKDRVTATHRIGPEVATSTSRYTVPKVLFLVVLYLSLLPAAMIIMLSGA